jgi:WD40 repeat protein
MEYLSKLEKTPWEYQRIFNIPLQDSDVADSLVRVNEKVKLRDAIGDRRYRAWKMAQDQKSGGEVDLAFIPDNTRASKQGASIDLTSLITSATDDMTDSSSLSSDSSVFRASNLTPEQQRVADAKNRDVIRRCLDRAHAGNTKRYSRSNNVGSSLNPFLENGRDLMAEAEKALRNPTAKRFLLSILAQRSRLENQRVRTMRRQSVQSSVSRLDAIAFECLIRLSCAMLDSCMENKEYEPAYRLLAQTAGFMMLMEKDEGEESEADGHAKHDVLSMTSRIGLHPIFADLGVWKTVMGLHLLDRQSEKKVETRLNDDDSEEEDDEDEVEYEAAVATLYEMVGYGIPGEELSRFAMEVSKEHGWFYDDRGRQLLMLARRISIRRDQAYLGAAGDTGDIDMIRKVEDGGHSSPSKAEGSIITDNDKHSWLEIAWCHPAAPTSRNALRAENPENDAATSAEDYMKRSSVTALASFGSSVVVTGGLDGSVFLAHSICDTSDGSETMPAVRGIHLDWGSASRAGAGSSSDGEYGVGAVSCLAAAHGSGQHPSSKKDTRNSMSEEDILASMEGSRVVAGTTAGDLRVWSVKDVYSAIMMTKKDELDTDTKTSLGGGNASTRLKFSLRGRALSGHRGGVTCIDVPSHVYRPDSLVTGGADGLIKLWSLRAPTGGRVRPSSASAANEGDNSGQQRGRGGDAESVLSGHNGRIMCIKTAWHGDRLLSGGADRTLRVWDLAASGGKCLHTLTGHFGWVTDVQYWGPNTIVSASTDRSVALWDARVRSSPLFMLRHHHSPITALLVGSRTDPLMVSAAADGTVASWDFRTLSGSSSSNENSTVNKDSAKNCKVVRVPAATMRHGLDGKRRMAAGPVMLSRGVNNPQSSILSIGSDSIVREWEVATGSLLDETPTGHCDAISSFRSFGHGDGLTSDLVPRGKLHEGTLTSSWDGTVRMRRLVRESK